MMTLMTSDHTTRVEIFHLISLIVILNHNAGSVRGGSCWQRVNSHGNCEKMLMQGVSRSECCNGPFLNTAWTADNIDTRLLFLQEALGNGIPNCRRCIRNCENVRCHADKVCKIKNGLPRCVCRMDCDAKEYGYTGPLCGFDEKSYRDICHLKRRNCRHNKRNTIDYRGRCKSSCENVDCGQGKYCVLDQNHTPHCIACNQRCRPAQAHDKRCGSDGITYDSMCKLFAASCLKGRAINAAYKGPCIDGATCDTLKCPGSDKCVTDIDSGRPRCVQCDYCSPYLTIRTICGTDGVTYESWCDLRAAMCRKGVMIATKHSGRCRADEVFQEGAIKRRASYTYYNDYQDDADYSLNYDYS